LLLLLHITATVAFRHLYRLLVIIIIIVIIIIEFLTSQL